jgi:hypothetical protein
MIFKTANSMYEIDSANNRLRRLNGANNPTNNQGSDGEWKHFESISPITLGDPVMVVWHYDDEESIIRRTQITSVLEILK